MRPLCGCQASKAWQRMARAYVLIPDLPRLLRAKGEKRKSKDEGRKAKIKDENQRTKIALLGHRTPEYDGPVVQFLSTDFRL